MSLKTPSASTLVKIVITTAALALIAYLLFPVLGLTKAAGSFVIGTALGAFLGSLAVSMMGSASAPKMAAAANGETQSVFVGNLAFKASRDDLRELFSKYGTVHSVRIMTDRATRRPRGFGFVEMATSDADRAIKALDGQEFHGRPLRVNQGNERRPVQNAA